MTTNSTEHQQGESKLATKKACVVHCPDEKRMEKTVQVQNIRASNTAACVACNVKGYTVCAASLIVKSTMLPFAVGISFSL